MAVQVNQISSSTNIESKYPDLLAQIIDQHENGISRDELYEIFNIDTEDEEEDLHFQNHLAYLEYEGYIYTWDQGQTYAYERDPDWRLYRWHLKNHPNN